MTGPSLPLPAGGPERRYRRLVDAHFRGRLSPPGEREMRGHLVTCGLCRAYYDRHLLLTSVDPDGALPMHDRLARGLGLSSRTLQGLPFDRRQVLAAVSAAAAACALVLVIGSHRRLGPEPRGAAPGSQLLAYEFMAGETPHPVVSQIHADAGLAFAYANIGHKRRLMVFAVDGDRRVYWYLPAWQRQAENPIAVEIVRDDELHEIPQATTHHFAGRRLQIFGVFLDQAMSARDMEDLVVHAPSDGKGRLQVPVPGADVTQLALDLVTAR